MSLEFPPVGIDTSYNWLKDDEDTVTGNDGNTSTTQELSTYKTVVENAPYGNGAYKAWTTDTWASYESGTTIATGEWPACGAFDKDEGDSNTRLSYHTGRTYSNSSDNSNPGYLALEMPLKIKLTSYSVKHRPGYESTQAPKKWTLAGRNGDGADWEDIQTDTVSSWTSGVPKTWSVSTTKYYSDFRFAWFQAIGNGQYISLYTIKLYGVPYHISSSNEIRFSEFGNLPLPRFQSIFSNSKKDIKFSQLQEALKDMTDVASGTKSLALLRSPTMYCGKFYIAANSSTTIYFPTAFASTPGVFVTHQWRDFSYASGNNSNETITPVRITGVTTTYFTVTNTDTTMDPFVHWMAVKVGSGTIYGASYVCTLWDTGSNWTSSHNHTYSGISGTPVPLCNQQTANNGLTLWGRHSSISSLATQWYIGKVGYNPVTTTYTLSSSETFAFFVMTSTDVFKKMYMFTGSATCTEDSEATYTNTKPLHNPIIMNSATTSGGDISRVYCRRLTSKRAKYICRETPPETKNGSTYYKSIDEGTSNFGGTIYNNAQKKSGYVELTTAAYSQNGEIQWSDMNPGNRLYATFDSWTGGGNGADATWFYWGCTTRPIREDFNSGGYLLAIDEYGTNEIQLEFNNSRLQTTVIGNIDDSTWHSWIVEYKNNTITVWRDGTEQFSKIDTSRTLSTLVGWGARTGGATNRHLVRNMKVWVSSEDGTGYSSSNTADLPVYAIHLRGFADFGSKPFWHLDANFINANQKVSNSGEIRRWRNSSGRAFKYAVGKGTSRPTLGNDSDGYYVYFNKSQSQYFKIRNTIKWKFTDGDGEGTGGVTAFCVFKFINIGSQTWPRFFDFGNGSGDNVLWAKNSTGSETCFVIHNPTARYDATNSLASTEWQIYTVKYDNSDLECFFWSDGMKWTPNETITATATDRNTTINYIGESNWSNDDFLDGYMREQIVFNDSLNNSQIRSINMRLGKKWNIPTWTLLFRQTIGYWWTSSQSLSLNSSDPDNDNYSILDQIDTYKNTDGKYRLRYLDTGDSSTAGRFNDWRQTSKFTTTSESVSGYEAVSIYDSGSYWGGLAKSNSNSARFDGDIGHGGWWFAVATMSSTWDGGRIPALSSTSQMEIYIMKEN